MAARSINRSANRFSIVLFLAFVSVLGAETVPGRYIVELTTAPVSDQVSATRARISLQGAAASSQRALVRTQQQQVRRELEQRQARILDSVDTVANALFVEMPETAAAQVAAMSGVKRVVPVRKFHLLLDRAVLLHKVADVWNRVGAEHAGEGVKIAIIDTGIDATHAGFQDSSMAAPDSFPRANSPTDLAYTNGKIIVARSYVNLLQHRDPDSSARDHMGHGTALAMVAAGVRNAGPLATITGVAPRAYLGNYKVFGTPGFNDSATDTAILKALDDAVNDGMDIISFSLGDDLAPRLSDDVDVQAVERATKAGVIVVASAGNNGPDLNTMASPATAPSAIAVGATTNDRTFAASAEVAGFSKYIAITGNGPAPSAPITASVVDVAALDGNGLACSVLPANSLTNRIALILRGTCTFETKLLNARQAGAQAALVYAAADSPDPVAMAVGSATLPAEMIAYADGASIKQALAGQSGLVATLSFTLSAVPVTANRLMDFSAAGPNVDTGIKPDLTAVGADIYVATQTLDENGDMYDPSGYVMVDGTSFSAPLVAGAAALIKSARPGLTVDQYRSLLINTAVAVQTRSGDVPGVQQAGAGLLGADAAIRSTVTAYPVSLSFGSGAPDAQVSRNLTLTNVGQSPEIFSIYAAPRADGPAPAIGTSTVELAAGASMDVPINWKVSGLTSGTYEGFIAVQGTASGTLMNVPYWYAARSGVPAHITILDRVTSARRGSAQRDAVLFRITDASGLPLLEVQPEVTAISGDGVFRGLTSHDAEVPGLFGIDLQLGATAGANVFRIRAGSVSVDVSITAL